RAPGQLRALCAFARPHLGVITNIGPAHLEQLGSLERIAEAKSELLPFVEEAVLPVEPLLDPFVPPGLPGRRFAPDDVLSYEDGCGVFRVGDDEIALELNLTMAHNAVNVLPALHAYAALGLPLVEVQQGATRIESSPWHGQELPLPGDGVLIADCWNA